MTIDTLFGIEEIPPKSRTIKFKQIKAVYETLTVREDIPAISKQEPGTQHHLRYLIPSAF